jgi:hypothetical protein
MAEEEKAKGGLGTGDYGYAISILSTTSME